MTKTSCDYCDHRSSVHIDCHINRSINQSINHSYTLWLYRPSQRILRRPEWRMGVHSSAYLWTVHGHDWWRWNASVGKRGAETPKGKGKGKCGFV